MTNKKLFKKLTEKIEVNRIIKEDVTEKELREVENKVIFENFNEELVNDLVISRKEETEE